MAVHGELRPDDNALPLIVAAAALNKADSAMTRPTGSVRIDNGDGTETWMGDAASENGGIVQWVGDTTPPAQPTGFTAVCQMGVVVASWAGTLAEPIPPDFSHVEVYAQKDGDTTVTDAGALYGAGSVTLTGGAEGAIIDLWAVAYDDAHNQAGESTPNASPKSDVVSVIIEPVVSQQQLADKAAEILAGSKDYTTQLTNQINSDMATAKKTIDANTDAAKTAQQTADEAKQNIASTASKVESIDSSLSSVKSTLDSTVGTVSTQGSALDKANSDISALQSRQTNVESIANAAKTNADNAVSTAGTASSTAADAANVAADAKSIASEARAKTVTGTSIEYGVSSSPTRVPGDYYTYAEGEPDKSVSVMAFQWDTTPPAYKQGRYVWERTRVTYGDGSSTVSDPVVVTGTGVLDVKPYWAVALTAPAKPTVKEPGAPWQDTEPAYQYDASNDLYKTSRVTYSDGSFAWTSVVQDGSYSAARDAETVARDAKQTAVASQTLATTAAGDASTAKQQASKAVSTATDASTTASNANTTATAARTAANSAAQQAANAAGIANGKADVLIQSTTPGTSMQKSTTLWIDTTSNANTPKKWNGSTWVTVTDKTAVDAASQAANATSLANKAQTTADSARVTAENAQANATKAQAAADGAQTTANGKNTIYTQESEPAHAKLVPGDLWYQRNNYRTYAEGEPDKSVSVMEIPSSRIKGVKIWDGSQFNDYVFVADKIIAENSVTTGLLAADAIYGKVLKGGEFLTSNGRLVINDAGLVARNSNGVNTLAVDANTGAVSMLGSLTSGSTVTGATVNGGTVDASEYQLHSGSTLVGKANASGIYFGDSLSYAQSGSTWKLTLKNSILQASSVNGCTVTGGTVQTDTASGKGVKITSGGLVAYDKNGAATLTVDATSGSILMKGAVSTNSTLNTPAINSGTVTGAVIQTTASANRGVKIDSGGLKAWDGNGNQTLDLNGSKNTMTGTFRTALSGARIEISNKTVDNVTTGQLTGRDIYGNVNWLISGDIYGTGIYGDNGNPPDPLAMTTLHLGISEQNPEVNITGYANGYRQISVGANRIDLVSVPVTDKTHVPDPGIYLNGIRIDPHYITTLASIMTLENTDWQEYCGADGKDPRTRLLVVGNLRFLTVELKNHATNILQKWRAATLLDAHIPANGINACAAMTGGQVGDAYIIGRNVDTGVTLSNGQKAKAGDIIIDPQNPNTANWFAATFIYQV